MFSLTEKQKQVWNEMNAEGNNYTDICLYGGSRSGKTVLILLCIILRALKEKSTHLIIRSTYESFDGTILGSNGSLIWLLQKTKLIKKVKQIDSTRKKITFKNGSVIKCYGLDQEKQAERKLGLQVATIFFNECAVINYQIIGPIFSRLAIEQGSKLKAKTFYDFNPPTKLHWTYSKFIEFKDPITKLPISRDNYYVAKMNPIDNPTLQDEVALLETRYAGRPEELKRFRDGEFTEGRQNMLFNIDDINRAHNHDYNYMSITKLSQMMDCICIGVDPAGDPSDKSDLTGIVVVGRRYDDKKREYDYFVLEDASDKYEPLEWTKKLYSLYEKWEANKIVVEKNYGGAYVLPTINSYYLSRQSDYKLPVEMVTATRGYGKAVRADPVSVLYKTNNVKHITAIDGDFDNENRLQELEEQMVSWTGAEGEKSPDRMDALVYGFYYWLDPNVRKTKDGTNLITHQGFFN